MLEILDSFKKYLKNHFFWLANDGEGGCMTAAYNV